MRTPSRLVGVVLVAGLVVSVGVMTAAATRQRPRAMVWTTFKTGMALAKKHDRPTMVHFTTDWCGWCRKLEQDVYTVPEVIELSQQFVCIRVDGDKERQVVQYYKIRGYPTILFTNSNREEVHRIPGFVPAERFLGEMKAALKKAGVEEGAGKKDTETKDDKDE